jgi:hypothetical protein
MHLSVFKFKIKLRYVYGLDIANFTWNLQVACGGIEPQFYNELCPLQHKNIHHPNTPNPVTQEVATERRWCILISNRNNMPMVSSGCDLINNKNMILISNIYRMLANSSCNLSSNMNISGAQPCSIKMNRKNKIKSQAALVKEMTKRNLLN